MLLRKAFSSVLIRNVVRYNTLQPRNVNLLRQYATKIEPKKKSSMKLLIIGVSRKIEFIHANDNYIPHSRD